MAGESEASQASAGEVRDRALRLLARREHAPAELAFKLAQRGYPPDLVQTVLHELAAEDLLSSRRYAESLVRARIDKGRGLLRIRDELTANGIDESDIDNALTVAEVDWDALAAQVRRKRFGAGLPDDFPAKAKQMRFLQQRGFTTDQIQAALER